MGHSSYSSHTRSARAETKGYHTKPAEQIFESSMNNAMSPHGVTLREARDSEAHPCSIPIFLGLDTTGSMGPIPLFLVRNGLPHMVETIIKAGIPDPQVLFTGIGDHECDRAPLQIGQYESGDEELDHWLTTLWLEGNGGGNYGESYLLAWFFAALYTAHDHFEKRGKKGLLFTIGDEPTLKELPARAQKALMGDGQYSDITSAELLDKARETYEVFHLHMLQGSKGLRPEVQDGWKQLLGDDHVIMVQDKADVAQIIADTVLKVVNAQNSGTTQAPGPQDVQQKDDDGDGGDGPMML